MVRSTRMFEIIQLLRSASGPQTAQSIADELEVNKRTIYRDVASLQAMRIPIEGAAGLGYIMRPGFDLPPINFDVEEAEALCLGLLMITRTGDSGLQKAARRAARKLGDAAPLSQALFSSSWGTEQPAGVDLSEIRNAIRTAHKIEISYLDADQTPSHRLILPVALVYYAESIVLAAWCELRNDFRHFRLDRVVSYRVTKQTFPAGNLRGEWAKLHSQDL